MNDHAARFTFSGPSSWTVGQAIRWASERGFRRVDFNADSPANYPSSFSPSRIHEVRALAADRGVTLGIHTLSAVNMAEITPVMAAAADEYIRQNLELAQELGCSHVIVHGGFHFTSDVDARFEASIRRLRLAVELAAERGVELHLENHNAEPAHAEIRYLPHTVAEMRRLLDGIGASSLRWAANVGHALLVPDGFIGFLDALGAERIGHVRLHDTNGLWEEHFLPGEGGGIVDFPATFRLLHGRGYRGPFSLDFGSPDERVIWRDRFAAMLAEIESES